MPPVSKVSKAGAFLLVLVVTSSILTTTTVVVAASSATTVGGDTNDLSLVRKIKNSKKTHANANANANANNDNTCTMEPFLGTSQYSNCKQEETKVNIACPNKGNAAAAAEGTPTKELCSYSEQPAVLFDEDVVLFDEDEAAAATEATAGCGVHGVFDPETHLTRDPATGVCRLKFFPLTSTCVGAPASSRFGVMVEASPTTSTGIGPGAHTHHEPNEDKNLKDNSGLLLRFSYDAGATYDNDEDPRTTVPLGRSSSRRMNGTEKCSQANPNGVFNGHAYNPPDKCFPYYGNEDKYCIIESQKHALNQQNINYHYNASELFKAGLVYAIPYKCFRAGDSDQYCYTKSYMCGTCGNSKYCTCTPSGNLWKEVRAASYYHPDRNDLDTVVYLCGTPCLYGDDWP